MTIELVEAEVASEASRPAVLVIACGAVAREVLAVVRLNGWDHVTLRCLPGKLHNTPRRIAEAVEATLVRAEAEGWDRIFVAYGDCGTGGGLDRVLATHGVERLPGDHCYAFLAGVEAWLGMHEAEPATFYLTDFLARHFERLVVRGYRLDEHPELKDVLFANYRRVLLLTQTNDARVAGSARRAAAYLGLPLQTVRTGYGEIRRSLDRVVEGASGA